MLLQRVVEASRAAAATRSRREKVRLLADVLGDSTADDMAVVASYLAGTPRQRRTGIGWRSLRAAPPPAATVSGLTVAEVDRALQTAADLTGAGSATARATTVTALLGRATEGEQAWLQSLLVRAVRQGAADALVQEALAAAYEVPLAQVRHAAMMAGSTPAVAVAVATGGAAALAGFALQVGRPVLPMLAASAPGVGEAFARVGSTPVAVEAKLDGIRIQVHRDGDRVQVVSRSLDDLTARLPEVVAVARSLPADRLVLDGEALIVDARGRPRPFQETAAGAARRSATVATVVPYFFDLLHLDGADLIADPARDRAAALARVVPAAHRPRRLVTGDHRHAEAFAAEVLRAGHEGVVVKDLDAPYQAGRRGSSWVKVKPVHTVDLVVLAVEQGSGRRRGWLSNIHLGAADGSGGWVMVGKTFKGMTDAMLAWQTQRFTELATRRDDWVVQVRPEQVVEIAFDGVQRSTRYPGGAALRFARVVRYRDDKPADQADTIDTIRSYLRED